MSDVRSLIIRLFDIGAIKLGGPFTLKSNQTSPIYIDLRSVVSEPQLMKEVSRQLLSAVSDLSSQFQLICGVPYTALPFASLMSVESNIPMLLRRKEVKSYGLKKLIEGNFSRGQNCLIVEDLITSGSSIIETKETLENEGIQVKYAVALLDREQCGVANLNSRGVEFRSVMKLSEILKILQEEQRINEKISKEVWEFISNNPAKLPTISSSSTMNSSSAAALVVKLTKFASISERISLSTNSAAKKLFSIMKEKQSNLCFSADVNNSTDLIRLIKLVGPHICLLKTHIDIIEDFSSSLINELISLSIQFNFLLFEDRKFADIGSTVKSQYSHGIFKMTEWAHFVNCHILPGPGVIEGLNSAIAADHSRIAATATQLAGNFSGRGIIIIAQMSSEGNLINEEYTRKCVELAEKHSDIVVGFVAQSRVSENPAFIHFTPGVQFAAAAGDGLGQQYNEPETAVAVNGADCVIVGRGIIKQNSQEEIVSAAIKYKESAWAAYLKRETNFEK